MRPPLRLIAIDIDGTLLDSRGALPDANRAALARAMEAGIEIVLATGRRFDFAQPVFDRIPGPLTLIVSNGAQVKTRAGTTLARHLLPRQVARDILAASPHARSRAALLFDRSGARQVVFERIDWEDPRYRRFLSVNRTSIAEVSPLEDALTEDPLQLTFTGGCSGMRALFEALSYEAVPPGGSVVDALERPGAAAVVAQPAPGAAPRYAVSLTEYLHRDFSLVDVLRAGCSKGAALRELAAGRGIPRESVMAVGDNLNDLEMLEFAGRPIVMRNGLDDLKRRGWPVTASNDEAGLARAIDEILRAGQGVSETGGASA